MKEKNRDMKKNTYTQKNKYTKKKKSAVGRFLWRATFIIALCVLLYSTYQLITIFLSYKQGTDEYDALRQYATKTETPTLTPTKTPTDVPEGESKGDSETEPSAQPTPPKELGPGMRTELTAPLQVDFASLQAINPDVKGWLYVEAMDISYPIVQGADNEQYLHRTYEGTDNFAGSIFIDFQNSGDFTDSHTIIYGHNMKNQSMFGKLKFFKEFEKYKDSVYFWILTPEENYCYQAFSSFYTDAVSDVYTLFTGGGKAFTDYLEQMKKRSQLPLAVPEMNENSRVITLSTCAARDSTQRFVVQGVRILPEESLSEGN